MVLDLFTFGSIVRGPEVNFSVNLMEVFKFVIYGLKTVLNISIIYKYLLLFSI